MNNAQRAVLAQLLARVRARIGSAPTDEVVWLRTTILEPLVDVLEIEPEFVRPFGVPR